MVVANHYETLSESLRQLKLFGDERVGLNDEEISACLRALEPLQITKGSEIFRQGDPAEDCYFIVQGRVRLQRIIAECSCGKKVNEDLEIYTGKGCIGEHSLVCGCARTATATAQSRCDIYRLTRSKFQEILRLGGPLRAIQRVPELAGYSLGEQERVASAVEKIHVEKGTKLLRQGRPSEGLYFIESGEATCTAGSGVCVLLDSNKELWRYGPGDYFGEETMCLGIASLAEVVVSTEFATVYLLRRESFNRIIPAHGKERFTDVWISRQLAKSEAFADLNPTQLEDLAKSKASIEVYDDGEVVFATDERCAAADASLPTRLRETDVIVVAEGVVVFKQKIRASPRSSLFTAKILGRIEAGDCFSFASMFKNSGSRIQEKIIAETEGKTVLVAAEQELSVQVPKLQPSLSNELHAAPVAEIRQESNRSAPKVLKRGAKWDKLTVSTTFTDTKFVRTPTENLIGSPRRKGNNTCSPRKRNTGSFGSDRSLVLSLESLETLDVLGHGAFGTVRLVRHRNTNHLYALKHMDKSRIERHNYERRVYREKEILRIVGQHPFVASLIRTFRDSSAVYLLLEACLAGDLFNLVAQKSCQVLNIHEIRFFGAQIVLALQHIHDKGVIYRDLKPENVIIAGDGYLRLTDFGMAKELSCSSRTNTFCGTPAFIAPEVFHRNGHDQMVDWWALGILLYEVSMGRFPFDGEGVSSMKICLQAFSRGYPDNGIFLAMELAKVSNTCVDMVRKLLHPDPTRRLGTADQRDMKQHKLFHGHVNWESILRKEATPPQSVINNLKTWKMPEGKWPSTTHCCGDCRLQINRKRRRESNCGESYDEGDSKRGAGMLQLSRAGSSQASVTRTHATEVDDSWDYAF